jgi:hypothetical protein
MLTPMGVMDAVAARVAADANLARIYGICVAVDGVPRPRLDGKPRMPGRLGPGPSTVE